MHTQSPSPSVSLNPFEFWSAAAQASMAAVTTAVDLSRAAATPWLATGGRESLVAEASAQEVTRAQPANRPEARRSESARSQTAVRSDTQFATGRSDTGRSWYRPPYRSPFDPMFWLSPGHPADHLPQWMAMTGVAAMLPGTGTGPTGWPTAWPMMQQPLTAMSPWTAGAGAFDAPKISGNNVWGNNVWGNNVWGNNVWGNNVWGNNVWGTDVWGTKSWGANGWGTPPATAAPTPDVGLDGVWSVNPWTAWLDATSTVLSGASANNAAATNVVDFTAAYSTYRTAGGHASAQISNDSGAGRPTSADHAAVPALLNLFWPWLK